jgi:hydroxymethylpyrimidine/phosphomethylpyrimidine kinase
VAAGIAQGKSLPEACRGAVDFVHRALEQRYSVGASKENFLAIDSVET